ncbi:hypothetical protein QLS91_11865 [Flavobacterium sp. LB2P84]|uniref:Uncharacterized protein n=1 Tax=Flavobacterium yafengii TaxID=3041253 RepID=A0AAW6TL65_9FLAO|nr:hypothetical protein [Flavobacterium yafengii]MDI5950320.1 hypothetical protein [Flavobacterium yafengii]MDI6033770.1 hypothetical protein [Flavobacterium yafengii]
MKIFFFIIALLFSSLFYSQTSGITYQAVILSPIEGQIPGVNDQNAPLANKQICLQFTIFDSNLINEYQEKVQLTTDEFGMVNVIIGKGIQTDGYAASFGKINWNPTKMSLKVSVDILGLCSSFEEISNQLFSSVPAAYTAENVTGIVLIGNGGTGGTTITEAKINLDLENVDNTSDLNKPLSTVAQVALNGKLDKVLKVPEEIITSNSGTLAIRGLLQSYAIGNQLISIDPVTGILSRASFTSSIDETVVDYNAAEGQVLFATPIPISSGNKVNVYRNGIRINAIVVDANTIKLEAGVICSLNDELKIIQFN